MARVPRSPHSVVVVLLLGRQLPTRLDRQLERSRHDEVTYQEVGGTRGPALPAGYRHDRLVRPIGKGADTWSRSKDAIRLWRAHTRAGIVITPSDAEIRDGSTVLASRRLGPVTIVAPCRVVYVTDEPSRFGFAYGTLPGHPERGEEAFHVVLGADGTVSAEIAAFSRPDDLATRVAGPIARAIQVTATRRYPDGIEAHAAGAK